MSEAIKLAALSREVKTEKPNKLRKEGLLPAVVYGHEFANQAIKVNARDFDKVLSQAGETHLVDLSIDGKSQVKVIVYDVSREQVKGRVQHVDFLKVNMKEKLTVEIPLHFVGESKAVRDFGAVVNRANDHVEVECLPDDLVDSIEVDLSVLNEFGDTITIADLKMPKGMTATHESDETIVSLVEQEKQEEAPVVEAEAAPAAEKKAE
ncbi:50S ribosomal protein L25 [Candidatus Falkowbacteria bacterium]|nr:50S ribosomal protein L25 [Candidatus Falkowbacteria bacterium]